MKINNLKKKIALLALCSLFAATCVPSNSFADTKVAPSTIDMQVNYGANTTTQLSGHDLKINLSSGMAGDGFIAVNVSANLVDYSTDAKKPVTLTYDDGGQEVKINLLKNQGTYTNDGMYRFFLSSKYRLGSGTISINDPNTNAFDKEFNIRVFAGALDGDLQPAPTIKDLNTDIVAYFPIESQKSYTGFIFYNKGGSYYDKFFFRPTANTSTITLNIGAAEANGFSYSAARDNSFIITYYNTEETYNKIEKNGAYDRSGRALYRNDEYYQTSVPVTSSSSVNLPWYPDHGIIEVTLKHPNSFLVKMSVKANPSPVNINGGVYTPEPEVVDTHTSRIGSANRYDTAINLSKEAFAKSDVAVVASGENFADALSGGGLAAATKSPLLLVNNQYGSDVNAELNRLDVKTVYLLGGQSSISESLEHELFYNNRGEKRRIIRLSGANRYDTSLAIYTEVLKMPGTVKDPILVNGTTFADALSAGPLAAKLGRAIVLTNGKTVSDRIDMNNDKNIVIGGYKSMDLQFAGSRIYGANRYETAAQIANSFYKPSTAIIASGEKYADGLAAITLYKKYEAPLLLTPKNNLPSVVSEYIKDKGIDRSIIVGGTGSVSNNVENQLKK